MTEKMNFSEALSAIKGGQKLQREGWNGKDMWLNLVQGIDKNTSGAKYDHLSYIQMKTVDDKLVPWLASQTDILANDWSIVE